MSEKIGNLITEMTAIKKEQDENSRTKNTIKMKESTDCWKW